MLCARLMRCCVLGSCVVVAPSAFAVLLLLLQRCIHQQNSVFVVLALPHNQPLVQRSVISKHAHIHQIALQQKTSPARNQADLMQSAMPSRLVMDDCTYTGSNSLHANPHSFHTAGADCVRHSWRWRNITQPVGNNHNINLNCPSSNKWLDECSALLKENHALLAGHPNHKCCSPPHPSPKLTSI